MNAADTTAGEAPVDRVLDALRPVLDPELGLSIVDLGLVGDVRRDAGALVVEILTTSPACPLRETLHENAAAALGASFAGETVEVRASSIAWLPSRMSDVARRALGWE